MWTWFIRNLPGFLSECKYIDVYTYGLGINFEPVWSLSLWTCYMYVPGVSFQAHKLNCLHQSWLVIYLLFIHSEHKWLGYSNVYHYYLRPLYRATCTLVNIAKNPFAGSLLFKGTDASTQESVLTSVQSVESRLPRSLIYRSMYAPTTKTHTGVLFVEGHLPSNLYSSSTCIGHTKESNHTSVRNVESHSTGYLTWQGTCVSTPESDHTIAALALWIFHRKPICWSTRKSVTVDWVAIKYSSDCKVGCPK